MIRKTTVKESVRVYLTKNQLVWIDNNRKVVTSRSAFVNQLVQEAMDREQAAKLAEFSRFLEKGLRKGLYSGSEPVALALRHFLKLQKN